MENASKIGLNHLGIIVDGNRRWAKEHNLPTSEGHRQGYEALKRMAYACKERGIKYVSAYIFSTENWHRSQDEVNYLLMKLFLQAFKNDMMQIIDDGFKIIFLGRRDRVGQDILDIMDKYSHIVLILLIILFVAFLIYFFFFREKKKKA